MRGVASFFFFLFASFISTSTNSNFGYPWPDYIRAPPHFLRHTIFACFGVLSNSKTLRRCLRTSYQLTILSSIACTEVPSVRLGPTCLLMTLSQIGYLSLFSLLYVSCRMITESIQEYHLSNIRWFPGHVVQLLYVL